jgi:hypothetical protein
MIKFIENTGFSTALRGLFILVLMGWCVGCFICRSQVSDTANTTNLPRTTDSPCAFWIDTSNPKVNDAFLEKQYREQYGHKKEISLREAIQLFNDDLRCYPNLAAFAPLTEDEFINAVAKTIEIDKSTSPNDRSLVLGKVLSDRNLPKGSAIVSRNRIGKFDRNTEPNEQQKLRVYLEIGLDINPDIGGSRLSDRQLILIR